jgi:hypothetical protein
VCHLKPTCHKLQFDAKHDYLSSNGLYVGQYVIKVGKLKHKLHKLQFDTKHDWSLSRSVGHKSRSAQTYTS